MHTPAQNYRKTIAKLLQNYRISGFQNGGVK